MTNRPVAATRRQRELAYEMADEFETLPLQNGIYDALLEDEQLAGLCDAAAEAAAASEQRERFSEDAEYLEDLKEAWGILSHIVRQRALEVVADTCVTIIHDGDQWIEDGHWDTEEIHDAIQEAREWTQTYTNPVNRVYRLAEVSE